MLLPHTPFRDQPLDDRVIVNSGEHVRSPGLRQILLQHGALTPTIRKRTSGNMRLYEIDTRIHASDQLRVSTGVAPFPSVR